MNALDLLQAVGATGAQLHTARCVAGAIFLSLLALLGLGLRKTRRLLSLHEAEVALEADFKRLERASSGKEA